MPNYLFLIIIFSFNVSSMEQLNKFNFAQIFEQHSIIMLLIEPESGRIVKANAAARQFYGYPDLTTMDIQQINLLNHEQVQQEIANAVAEKRDYFIFRHLLANGEIRKIRTYARAYQMDNKSFVLSIIVDDEIPTEDKNGLLYYQQLLEQQVDAQVTQLTVINQKQKLWFSLAISLLITILLVLSIALLWYRNLEQRLRESKEQFKSLVKNIPGITYRCHNDKVWSLIYLSDNVNMLNGYKLDNLIDIFHNDDKEMVAQAVSLAIAQEQNWEIEYRIFLSDGSLRWVREHGKAIKNNNKVKYLDGFIFDITEHKLAQQALQQRSGLITSLLNCIPDLIFFKDMQGVYLGCNPAFAAHLGMLPEDLIGKTDYMLYPPELAAEFRRNDQEMLAQLGSRHNEEWITYPDGRKVLLDTLKTPYWGLDGELIGILAISRDITERKKIEEELRAERDLFSEGPVFTITWDANHPWPITYVSDNVTHILGYTAEEMQQADFNYAALIHPDDAQRIISEVDYNIKHHINAYEQSYRLKLKNGIYRWFYDFTKLIRDDCAELRTIRGYLFDQTHLKELEHNLENQRQRLADIITGTNVGTWEWNVQTGATIFNERWAEMIGYTLEELAPISIETWLKFTHPDDAANAKQLLQQHFNGELDYYECELRMQHCNGNWIWMLDRGKVISWTVDAKPLLMSGTHQDITKRKQAEQLLQAKTEELDRYFTASLDLLCIADVNGKFMRLNPEWEKVLGYNINELHEKTFFNFVHPEDILATQDAVMTLQRGVDVASFENRYLSKYNDYRWIEWRARAQGQFIYAVARDITERKQTETALYEANEALTIAVAQAEMANKAKSIFLANMSHELRTPLNGILGYAQILSREKSLNPKQLEGIKIIQQSGEYLLTLISDVLDLSKIEAGKIELYPNDFNLKQFLTGIVDLFNMRAMQKNIGFVCRFSDDLPYGIYADEKRLRQILINLLSNAIKFTDKGEVKFKVNYAHKKLQFKIEDSGIGIAEEDLARIFLPFQQTGDANYRSEGTGLGLSITKSLVEMMGGRLGVESKLKQGSMFWFELNLPFATTTVSRTMLQPSISGYNIPEYIGKNQYTVLIVDDTAVNRMMLIDLLEPLGFITVAAENGAMAVALALSAQPDLIIMDLMMADMDGLAATRLIRQHESLKNTPIIAASASVFVHHRQESLAAGCNDFVAKPIREDNLFNILGNYLDLTWIYAQATIKNKIPNVNGLNPAAIQAKIIHDYALVGDIAGINAYLTELETNQPQLSEFIAQVHELLDNFELEQIRELTQKFFES
jgi:PAS domain S-box-containing protein